MEIVRHHQKFDVRQLAHDHQIAGPPPLFREVREAFQSLCFGVFSVTVQHKMSGPRQVLKSAFDRHRVRSQRPFQPDFPRNDEMIVPERDLICFAGDPFFIPNGDPARDRAARFVVDDLQRKFCFLRTGRLWKKNSQTDERQKTKRPKEGSGISESHFSVSLTFL